MSDLYSTDGPTPAAAANHLGQLHATDQHDPNTVSQQTLMAIAVILEERDRLLGIVKLARDMREAQKMYFRSKADLPGCKALESKFDKLVKE